MSQEGILMGEYLLSFMIYLYSCCLKLAKLLDVTEIGNDCVYFYLTQGTLV